MIFLVITDLWDPDLAAHLTARINALSFTGMPADTLSSKQALDAFRLPVSALNVISPEGRPGREDPCWSEILRFSHGTVGSDVAHQS